VKVYHTPTIIQSSTQPQKTQQPRKPKRKDPQVPQPSDPIENVTDEVVYKELGDSLVRAATTTSSLEAEHDSGNIGKTQSKATPNESSSLGTTSGGGPGCQKTMGDTIAQTRFENVSKHSNDSLLARGNTLQSDEDRLKLVEFMALCTTLQNRVLNLEKTKTTQHNEIASLKRKVKKLKKKNRSRTYKLKRLYKVSLPTRVESFDNDERLGEDASKQGRIDVINADGEITLEVFVAEQEVASNEKDDEVNVVEEVVEVINTAKLITDATTVSVTITTTATITIIDDITLAQALMEIKSTKPKEKGVVIQELGSQSYGSVLESERLERVSALRQPTLTTWIYLEDGIAYIDVPAYPPPALPAQIPPSHEWSSGSLPISPASSIVSSPISSHMIPLTVPSPIASPAMAETEGFLTELGARVEMQRGLIRNHMVRLEELSPTLFERVIWRPILALDSWADQADTQRAAMWHAISDTHRENWELRL
ncbi:hypothetical protein Tco_0778572, partial [Tanacetum coccineum]